MKGALAITLALGVTANAFQVWEDGKEYVYISESAMQVGTNDYDPNASGMRTKTELRFQVSGDEIKVHADKMKVAMFNHAYPENTWPYRSMNETKSRYVNPEKFVNAAFSFTLKHGLVQSIKVPSSAPVWLENMMKALASSIQLDLSKLSNQEEQFTTKEKNLHGDCFVQYTLEDNHNVDYKVLTKSVSHLKDCVNRRYRFYNNLNGYTCNADISMEKKFLNVLRNPDHAQDYASAMLQTYTPTEPLYSESTTSFVLHPTGGDNYKIAHFSTFGNVIVQPFSEEGASHVAITNTTMILKEVKGSSDDISVSAPKDIDNVEFTFEEGDWTWDKEVDMKEREHFFSTGFKVDETQEQLVQKFKMAMEKFVREMTDYKKEYHTKNDMEQLHKNGMMLMLPIIYRLDYNSLVQLKDFYFRNANTQDDVYKRNVYTEILSITGTKPSAVLIQEMVMNKEFDSDADAAKYVTSVAFHIRRPNKQLVKLYEQLVAQKNNFETFTKMAVPLAFAHLVRRTCELATPHPFQIEENENNKYAQYKRECMEQLLNPYIEQYFQQFDSYSMDQHEEIGHTLAMLYNFRWGKVADLLKDVVQGHTKHRDEYSVRTMAIFTMAPSIIQSGRTVEFLLPIFMDSQENHEVRIAAFDILMKGKPDSTVMMKIMKKMVYEKDNEVFNYVYTAYEKFADKHEAVTPCNKNIKEYAKYFLKYWKQHMWARPSYGFGISKTYGKTFSKDKYGYAGSFEVHTVGSHKSTSPLAMMFDVRAQHFGHHTMQVMGGYIRIKGLAQKLVEKLRHFTTFNPSSWNVNELKNILFSQMQIRERPMVPVEVDFVFMIKDNVVFHRYYNEESVNPGGKLYNFFMDIVALGKEYEINHQRSLMYGSVLYEQPTELGVPMAYVSGVTSLASLQAKVTRGQDSGAIVRKIDYQIQLNTQAKNAMLIFNVASQNAFTISQDRVYHHKFGSRFTGMINMPKHQVRFSFERPEYGEPMSMVMHSQTSMLILTNKVILEQPKLLRQSCPTCQHYYVISKGLDHKTDRYFLNVDNEEWGFHAEGKYFDCEAPQSKSTGQMLNVIAQAFNPVSKTPSDFFTTVTMGLRQVHAFLFYYPRVESCGVGFHWSQSKFNPVNAVEFIFTGHVKSKTEPRVAAAGKKFAVDGEIIFKGDQVDRVHHMAIKYEFEPYMAKTELAFKIVRNPFRLNSRDYPAYSMCMDYHARYPIDKTDPMKFDFVTNQQVKSDLSVSWGQHSTCSNNPGKIELVGEHETTTQAKEHLKTKWYYKTCMQQRQSNEWKATYIPQTDACFYTAMDLYTLNHFKWTAKFQSLEPWMISAYRKAETLVKSGLFPFWRIDLDNTLSKKTEFLYSTNSVDEYSPIVEVEQIYNTEKSTFDMSIQTNRDKNMFKNINYGWWTWNDEPYIQLQEASSYFAVPRSAIMPLTMVSAYKNHLFNGCHATTQSVRTFDNVTYPYTMHNCWTLVSAHCSPVPTYAVFMKKSAKFAQEIVPKMDTKIYIGGHEVNIKPVTHAKYEINIENQVIVLDEQETYYWPSNQKVVSKFQLQGEEPEHYKIKIHRLHKDFIIESPYNVKVFYDGNYVKVDVPAFVKGHQCGMCGDYNGDHEHELVHPEMCELKTGTEMAAAWMWEHNDSACPSRPACTYSEKLLFPRQTR